MRHLVQLGELILCECLGRKQVQRPRRRVVQDRVEHRRVVAERLARRRRGHDDDAAAAQGVGDGGEVPWWVGSPAPAHREGNDHTTRT